MGFLLAVACLAVATWALGEVPRKPGGLQVGVVFLLIGGIAMFDAFRYHKRGNNAK